MTRIQVFNIGKGFQAGVLVLLVALMGFDATNGQSVRGQLVGRVTDSSGGVIPGAEVKLVNQETNITQSKVTDESGNYEFLALLPGTYSITVTMTGFSTKTVTDLQVIMNQRVRTDVRMEIGEIGTQILVESRRLLAPTDQAETGQLIDRTALNELPLAGRNFLGLLNLAAGVVSHGGGPGKFRTDLAGTGYSVAGSRTTSVQYLIDGVGNNDPYFQTPAMTPSIDAIQEFKIQTSFYGADQGSASGQINVAIRSGTNSFHGSAYDYHRNSALQPKQPGGTYKDPQTGETYRNPFLRNLFGATVGGPILKDKSFFFFSYEGLRQRSNARGFAAVPTIEQRQGDFSQYNVLYKKVVKIYDPATTPTSGPIVRTQFPNNQIPTSRFSPIATKLMGMIPEPNLDERVNTINNYTGTSGSINSFNNYNMRVDHTFSESDSIFGRYSYFTQENPTVTLLPYAGSEDSSQGHNIALQWNRTFNPQLLNELRLGYNRPVWWRGFQTGVNQESLGLTNPSPYQPAHETLPQLALSPYAGFGFGGSTFDTTHNTYELTDALSWIRGNHSIKIGGAWRHNQGRWAFPSVTNGQITFGGGFTGPDGKLATGDAFADFLLGLPSRVRQRALPSFAQPNWEEYALYVQDNWKVTPKLTVDVGLRYEVTLPAKSAGGGGGVLDPTNGGRLAVRNKDYVDTVQSSLIVYDPSLPERIVDTDYLNFAPRIGFAWRPFSGHTFVVRSAYGVFYDSIPMHYWIGDLKDLYLFKDENLENIPPGGRGIPLAELAFPPLQSLSGIPSGPYNISVTDRRLRSPYTQRWNLTLDWNFRDSYLLEVAYTAAKGSKLPWQRHFNNAQPNPDTTSKPQNRAPYPNLHVGSWIKENANSSVYHAGTAKLEKRFSQGLAFLVNYAFSKNLDYGTSDIFAIGPQAATLQDAFNFKNERGPASFNFPHRLSASWVYELPFGPGRLLGGDVNPLLGKFIGGWQLAGVWEIQSGVPFSIQANGDFANVGEANAMRGYQVGDPYPSGWVPTLEAWFDPTAFKKPEGTFGNTAKMSMAGPYSRGLDVSVTKKTLFGPELNPYRVEFRAEFFNVLSERLHTGRTPGNSVNNLATLGRIGGGNRDSIFNPRVIQFGLRFVF